MKQNEIRSAFLEYFRERGHLIVPSDTLVPHGDKTLLFTNAGMNQFKAIFLNQQEPQALRIADSQKCMRVSGKHNDLEDVGRDTYHHTFFEMLGNWSFGDYYKAEAIQFAWELLTRIWPLPKEKLWATFHEDDEETRHLWEQLTDVTKSQILPFGAKDNFWEMGETGPCGPCSEIHIDLGSDYCSLHGQPGHVCGVNQNCPRYIELWNLVFIQYDRDGAGQLHPLPKKHVDTGMGFERIVSVLQGCRSNYDTDIFSSLISSIEQSSGVRYGEDGQHDISIRVVADHVRALTFLITDGVFPSNEGRGYVLRRILRRAVRHGMKLGLTNPFLHTLVDPCLDTMGEAYPDLLRDPDKTRMIIRREEERFNQTLSRGIHVLENMVEDYRQEGKTSLAGQDMFLLYDTYGFPPDLTRELVAEMGMSFNEQGFRDAMALQKEKGRAARDKETADQGERDQLSLYKAFPPTHFTGYQTMAGDATVLALFRGNQELAALAEGETGECLLDQTPFYGEAGGQVGDTGSLEGPRGKAIVANTLRAPGGQFLHLVKVEAGILHKGDRVRTQLDRERRWAIMRNHTTTHLLHAVLRENLGDHVRQAGSLVAPDYFRFDFTHFEKIEPGDLLAIEEDVNKYIRGNHDVQTEITDLTKAVDQGAMALFDEKYSETVRMIRIPGVSLELCGGTHVKRTGDIGILKVLHEGGVAAGVRRIEARTGTGALDWIRRVEADMETMASVVKAARERLPEKVKILVEQLRDLERDNSQLRDVIRNYEFERLLQDRLSLDDINLVRGKVNHLEAQDLATLCDQLKSALKSGVIVLAAEKAGKVVLVAAVTPDLTGRIQAGKLVGQIARIVGGGGGGRPDFAQAGGKLPHKIEEALQAVPTLITRGMERKEA